MINTPRSLSLRLLQTSVTLIFWLITALFSFLALNELYEFFFNDYHVFALENLNLHITNSNDRTTLRETGQLIHINPSRFSISFAYDDPRVFATMQWLYLATTLPVVAVGVVLIYLLWNLKQVINTIGTTTIFSQQNVWRVRTIGLCVIGIWLLEKLPWWLSQSYVTRLLTKQSITYGNSHTINILNSWMVGVLIIALAEVFRQGVIIKKENELTI